MIIYMIMEMDEANRKYTHSLHRSDEKAQSWVLKLEEENPDSYFWIECWNVED